MDAMKQELYGEAAIDDAAIAGQTGTGLLPAVVGTDAVLLERIDRIDAQLMAIAALIGADSQTEAVAAAAPLAPPAPAPVAQAAAQWCDNTLDPGQGVEVKLVMQEGTTAAFEWTAHGGVLNHE